MLKRTKAEKSKALRSFQQILYVVYSLTLILLILGGFFALGDKIPEEAKEDHFFNAEYWQWCAQILSLFVTAYFSLLLYQNAEQMRRTAEYMGKIESDRDESEKHIYLIYRSPGRKSVIEVINFSAQMIYIVSIRINGGRDLLKGEGVRLNVGDVYSIDFNKIERDLFPLTTGEFDMAVNFHSPAHIDKKTSHAKIYLEYSFLGTMMRTEVKEIGKIG